MTKANAEGNRLRHDPIRVNALTTATTPLLVAFSDGDPITGGMAPILRTALAGARGRDHPVITGAGHFLQEDAGEDLAHHVLTFVHST